MLQSNALIPNPLSLMIFFNQWTQASDCERNHLRNVTVYHIVFGLVTAKSQRLFVFCRSYTMMKEIFLCQRMKMMTKKMKVKGVTKTRKVRLPLFLLGGIKVCN